MMQTLIHPASATYEIKQSRFIAHLVPYAQFGSTLEALKPEHPKARHFVTAYRYRNDFGQIVEGCSDDGEPRGTSGKPSLAVIAGQELIDVGLITVRYFGGTKLGTGGLVRAYSQAANDVIAAATLEPFIPKEAATFACDYNRVGIVEHALKAEGIVDTEPSFEAMEVRWRIQATREQIDAFFRAVGRNVRR